MRFLRILTLSICVALGSLTVHGQGAPTPVSPAEVQAAIEAAKATMPPGPYLLQSRPRPITTDPDGKPLDPKLARLLNANPPPPTTYGAIYTPFIRIAMLARKAVESYKPFTAADVPQEFLDSLVYVVVRPFEKSGGGISRFVDAQHVVIMPTGSHDPAQATQPVWVKADTNVLQNAFGAKVETRGIVAAFPREAMQVGRQFVFIYAGPIIDGPGLANITQQRLDISDDVFRWR